MITVAEETAATLVRVDGWLTGEGVAEFVRVLGSVPAPVRLLLHDLRGSDAAGLSVLGRLAGEGTTLEGLSPYLQLMLADAASHEPPSLPPIIGLQTSVRRKDA
jgi:hypothetical protein